MEVGMRCSLEDDTSRACFEISVIAPLSRSICWLAFSQTLYVASHIKISIRVRQVQFWNWHSEAWARRSCKTTTYWKIK
jgi:hypothetical protein